MPAAGSCVGTTGLHVLPAASVGGWGSLWPAGTGHLRKGTAAEEPAEGQSSSLSSGSLARASPHRSACLLSQPFPPEVRFSLKSDYLFGTSRIPTAVPAQQPQMRHAAVHWNGGFAAAVLPRTWKGFSCELPKHNTGQRARPAAPRLPGGWKRWNYSAYPWKRARRWERALLQPPGAPSQAALPSARTPGGAGGFIMCLFFSEMQLNSFL